VTAAVSDPGTAPVGEILRRARNHRGLSLRDVEDRTGIPNAHLSQIERGVIRRPNPGLLMTLCDLYDLNYELLALWGGYLDEHAVPSTDRLLEAAMRVFTRLDVAEQGQLLREMEALERARSDASAADE
jgi:transcriptional regulator with XRE-family HTH domain